MVDHLRFAVPRLLDLLDAEAQSILFRHTRRTHAWANQLVHQRGDLDGSVGIVISGTVQLLRREADGRVVSDSTVSSGEHYGDVSVLDPGERRTHEAVALTDSVIEHLDRQNFEHLLATQPVIVNALYRIATRRLAVTIELLDDARSLRPIDRISKAIGYAVDASGGDLVVRCRQEEIAQLLGLSGVTVSKGLAELQRRGAIKLGYRMIRVLSRADL